MTDKPGNFRERLLGAQPISHELKQEYQKELDELLTCRLTMRSRLLAVASIIVSLIFAAGCIRNLIIRHNKPELNVILPAFAAVFLATAGYLVSILRKGSFSRRASFQAVELLGGIFVGAYAMGAMIQSMRNPASPNTIISCIWAVMLIIVGMAWATGNRIAAANLDTREHLLRIESRLADLNEKLKT